MVNKIYALISYYFYTKLKKKYIKRDNEMHTYFYYRNPNFLM